MNAADALARRLVGAVLLSLALHAFLFTSFKPASAQYAGDPFFRVQLRTASAASLEAAPPGRGATSSPLPSAGTREPSAGPRPLPADARFTKSYLGGTVSRRGNLPDGREAHVELDTALLSQYYTAREVDERAIPLEEVPLFNPLYGPGSGSTAKVILLLLINENGGVDSVATLEARPKGAFDGIARTAFSSIRFSPALKDGRPVKSQKVVEVIYGS
jgi:outer membrane biosynthesis protein TonB